MKRTNPALPLPDDAAVAMVVTKAPSEPWSLVQQTLEAALAQAYPHDTWLADEDPSPDTIAWCRENGVQISSRKGVPDYHRPVWPRRSRCKEGNLSYFYDHYGYENYDFVVQMDADHRPGRNYLEEMIRPFADPRVGYVSAPSICDANAQQSWAVRGRLFAEAPTHGPLQAGYSAGFAPLCIGSHYAVRTRALRGIGGLGPELAEDHSTTFLMNATGWNGIHALDASARGDGPSTFTDLVTQEFQWSKSLTKILLTLTPRHFSSLSAKLKLQFLFSQLWYVFFGLTMLGGTLIPPLALVTNTPWVTIAYSAYWAGTFILTGTVMATFVWIKRNGWLRPVSAPLISWEAILFHFVRWPWLLLGVVSAFADVLGHREVETFRVTPKGVDRADSIPKWALAPYVMLALISGLPVLMVDNAYSVAGYGLFASLNSLIYSGLLLALLCLHIREKPISPALKKWLWHFVVAVVCLMIACAAMFRSATNGLHAITWGVTIPSWGWPGRTQPDHAVELGIYDPHRAFADSKAFGIEQFFLDWASYDSEQLKTSITATVSRGRRPMLTVEPWPYKRNPEQSRALFSDIVAGRYDEMITRLCTDINTVGAPVLIRWGHEMENVNGRYPWAQNDVVGYVRAYRHFVDMCRRLLVPRSYFVWSPVGHKELSRYWPGPDYVDCIGVSIYGFPEYDLQNYGRTRSFDAIFSETYQRVSLFDKPVIIAELGVTGNARHQRNWMHHAFRSFRKYPKLQAAIYFSSQDSPLAWGSDYSVPDWRISPSVFAQP
jgi:cellulose synthase (UDP-forming)